MTRLLRTALVVAASCAIGCGGGLVAHVPADTQAALRPDIAAVRAAVAAGDRAAADQALAALRQHVTQLHDARVLPDPNEHEILAAADTVAGQLDAIPTTTTTTSTTTTTTVPITQAPPAKPPGKGKGNGNGDGEGG